MTMHAITPPPAAPFRQMLVTAGAPEREQPQSQSQSAGGAVIKLKESERAVPLRDHQRLAAIVTLNERYRSAARRADLLFPPHRHPTFTVYGDGGTERDPVRREVHHHCGRVGYLHSKLASPQLG